MQHENFIIETVKANPGCALLVVERDYTMNKTLQRLVSSGAIIRVFDKMIAHYWVED